MYSRIPLNLQNLHKALPDAVMTDWVEAQDDQTYQIAPGVNSDYRTPFGRSNGNVVFRRYLDGSLDIDGAKHIIIDVLRKTRNLLPITDLEKLILNTVFPTVFPFMDAVVAMKMANVQFQLTPNELQDVAMAIAGHLAEELNFNGGAGGGTVPGRNLTTG